MNSKRVSESRTEQVQILMSKDINGANRLFGGRLMEWIDVVAAVVARRHSERTVTTAAIDSLEFHAPAYLNNTLCMVGRITYAGRTSMEIRVDSFTEDLHGKRVLINRAYLVMVALDENDRPVQVPGLTLETPEEEQEWVAAEQRRQMRRLRKLGGQEPKA